jgi:hypothetical protein
MVNTKVKSLKVWNFVDDFEVYLILKERGIDEVC